MVSILASIGIGGTLGTILGVMEDPVSNAVIKFAFKKLRWMSKGGHLSGEEKKWIHEYNNRKCIINGVDYTQQMRINNMLNWR